MSKDYFLSNWLKTEFPLTSLCMAYCRSCGQDVNRW